MSSEEQVVSVNIDTDDDGNVRFDSPALSSRDAQIREVLEGLAVLVPDGFCWCAVASDLHEPECLAARALYARLQPPEKSLPGE